MSPVRKAALIALICFIWGSTWLAIKLGLEDLPPFLAAGVRFSLATVVLAALSWWRGLPFPRGWGIHLWLLGLGMVQFVVSYGAVYWGELYIPSGLSAVLFATYPLFVLVLAHWLIAAERIDPRKSIGVALGFLGVVAIFRSDLALTHPLAPLAAAVTLASPLASAASSVTIKRWGRDLHPYTLTTLPMAYGAVGLLGLSLLVEDPGSAVWSPAALGSIAYLAVFGSVVAFVTYYRLLKEVAVSSLALVTYVFPVVAVALGWIVLRERLTGWELVGAAAIVAGIAIATRRRRAVSPASSPGRGRPPT